MRLTRSTDRAARAGSRAVLSLLMSVVALALAAAPAYALGISAPANVVDRADVKVSVTSSDRAGLLTLVVDGASVRSAVVTTGTTVTFGGVLLSLGDHRLSAFVRSAGVLAVPSRTIHVRAWPKPMPPVVLSPTPGGWVGARVGVTVRVGAATTRLAVKLNGTWVNSIYVRPGQVLSLGMFSMGSGTNRFELFAVNPATQASYAFSVRRLDYPWPTCIIIDKSDFRLYWVRDGVLVKAYPIAIGKPSTPTPDRVWRIDEKLYTDPGSVYGPRKMRLFKQSGSSYLYTGYGIHGTNQEWVIGTMASHGCIRMYNRDVLELFPQVPMHTMVLTRD